MARQLTWKRKFIYSLIKPLIKVFVRLTWMSCRIRIVGEDNILNAIKNGQPVIPCYWHQMHMICSYYMIRLQKKGLKVGFLVSPSMDGEVPADIMRSWGATIIRGSSTRTGAQAIRELYNVIKKDGVSPVNTPDGPKGPIYEFKRGAVMLAQLTQVPIVPLCYQTSNAWYLKSWDRFMLPKPFSKVIIAVGEICHVDKKLSIEDLEPIQEKMEEEMQNVIKLAQQELAN